MRRAAVYRVVPLMMLLSSVILSTQERPALPEPFRLNPKTGALEKLEQIRSTNLQKGRGVAFFVFGDSSPIEFDRSEPLTFVVRLKGNPSVEEVEKQQFFRLEPLAVREKLRFATGRFVPYVALRSGEPQDGVQAFRIAPRVTLPLGEYAFSAEGLFGDAASETGREGWAFQIVER